MHRRPQSRAGCREPRLVKPHLKVITPYHPKEGLGGPPASTDPHRMPQAAAHQIPSNGDSILSPIGRTWRAAGVHRAAPDAAGRSLSTPPSGDNILSPKERARRPAARQTPSIGDKFLSLIGRIWQCAGVYVPPSTVPRRLRYRPPPYGYQFTAWDPTASAR